MGGSISKNTHDKLRGLIKWVILTLRGFLPVFGHLRPSYFGVFGLSRPNTVATSVHHKSLCDLLESQSYNAASKFELFYAN